MASTPKTEANTDLDLSGIVDGQPRNAGDVVRAFDQSATAIDQARQTISVSPTDTHVKHLIDAVTAGTGAQVARVNPGGDEKLSVGLGASGIPFGQVGIADGSGGVNFGYLQANVDIVVTAQANVDAGDFVFVYGAYNSQPLLGYFGQVAPVLLTSGEFGGPVRGIMLESVTAGNSGAMRVVGLATVDQTLTPFRMYYPSIAPGVYVPDPLAFTMSSGSNYALTPVGYAVSTSQMLVYPMRQYIARVGSVANNATLAVQHGPDASQYLARRVTVAAVDAVPATAVLSQYSLGEGGDFQVAFTDQYTTTVTNKTGGTVNTIVIVELP